MTAAWYRVGRYLATTELRPLSGGGIAWVEPSGHDRWRAWTAIENASTYHATRSEALRAIERKLQLPICSEAN